MTDEFDGMYDTFKALLDSFPPSEAVKRLEQLGISPDIVQQIRERHEQQTIRVKELEEPHAVVLGNRDTWYTGPHAKDKCWPAIVDLLRKDGWPQEPTIRSLDDSSTRVVSLLNHPKEKSFSTRGLVVGYVQSGKTTNFTSVMAKAADRGYKLFIVLAGNPQRTPASDPGTAGAATGGAESLDVVPVDRTRQGLHSAGEPGLLLRQEQQDPRAVRGEEECHGAPQARPMARRRRPTTFEDCPALIIDDEADQATVATKSINPLILDIMGSLPKSAYVGLHGLAVREPV